MFVIRWLLSICSGIRCVVLVCCSCMYVDEDKWPWLVFKGSCKCFLLSLAVWLILYINCFMYCLFTVSKLNDGEIKWWFLFAELQTNYCAVPRNMYVVCWLKLGGQRTLKFGSSKMTVAFQFLSDHVNTDKNSDTHQPIMCLSHGFGNSNSNNSDL